MYSCFFFKNLQENLSFSENTHWIGVQTDTNQKFHDVWQTPFQKWRYLSLDQLCYKQVYMVFHRNLSQIFECYLLTQTSSIYEIWNLSVSMWLFLRKQIHLTISKWKKKISFTKVHRYDPDHLAYTLTGAFRLGNQVLNVQWQLHEIQASYQNGTRWGISLHCILQTVLIEKRMQKKAQKQQPVICEQYTYQIINYSINFGWAKQFNVQIRKNFCPYLDTTLDKDVLYSHAVKALIKE